MSGAGSWRTVVGIGLIWAAILGIGILFMPESPRWSARHGNPEAARSAIAKVRALPLDHPLVDGELEEILASIEVQDGISRHKLAAGELPDKSERERQGQNATGLRGWMACFVGFGRGSSRIGYRTLLGMSLQSLQQLTGANYLYVHYDHLRMLFPYSLCLPASIMGQQFSPLSVFRTLTSLKLSLVLSISCAPSSASMSWSASGVAFRLSSEEYGRVHGFLFSLPRVQLKTLPRIRTLGS